MMPIKEGYFWAKWRIKAEGTADENEPANGDWEIVQVVENCQDEKDPEHLMVMVLGVEKWQSLENFVWGEAIKDKAEGK